MEISDDQAAAALGNLLGMQASIRAVLETMLSMTSPDQRERARDKTLETALAIVTAMQIEGDKAKADIARRSAAEIARGTFKTASRLQ